MTTYANRTFDYGLLPAGPTYNFALVGASQSTGYVPGGGETITVVSGNATVTGGGGTTFAATDVGYMLCIDGNFRNIYYVTSVDVGLQKLTLDRVWEPASEAVIAGTRWYLCLWPFTEYAVNGSAAFSIKQGGTTVTAAATDFIMPADAVFSIYTGNTALFWAFFAAAANVQLQRLESR